MTQERGEVHHNGRHFWVIRQWREDGTCDVMLTLELFRQRLEENPEARVVIDKPTAWEIETGERDG